MTVTAAANSTQALVGMGQIAVISGAESARAVLGSCLGVMIYDERKRLGALAHVVLPASSGRSGSPGKFVDTAIPWMIETLRGRGGDPRRFVVKLAGGANMFTASGPFQIGQQNIDAARQMLAEHRLRVVAEHLCGTQGRRVTFDCESCKFLIEVAGQQPVEI